MSKSKAKGSLFAISSSLLNYLIFYLLVGLISSPNLRNWRRATVFYTWYHDFLLCYSDIKALACIFKRTPFYEVHLNVVEYFYLDHISSIPARDPTSSWLTFWDKGKSFISGNLLYSKLLTWVLSCPLQSLNFVTLSES